jgi:hypothetical protein
MEIILTKLDFFFGGFLAKIRWENLSLLSEFECGRFEA